MISNSWTGSANIQQHQGGQNLWYFELRHGYRCSISFWVTFVKLDLMKTAPRLHENLQLSRLGS